MFLCSWFGILALHIFWQSLPEKFSNEATFVEVNVEPVRGVVVGDADDGRHELRRRRQEVVLHLEVEPSASLSEHHEVRVVKVLLCAPLNPLHVVAKSWSGPRKSGRIRKGRLLNE